MKKVVKTEQEWRESLTPEQYKVMREHATEVPGTGVYNHFYKDGKYLCAGCGNILFKSDKKYDAGCGWPSFYDKIDPDAITEHRDSSKGMERIEIRCAKCDAHLGHVFDDGPNPTGLRYCVNSVCLAFEPDEENKT